ncbi:ABC transporter substrate-binding protein [Ornithinicoccus halotolerans]|uniref:ABC transporter substrate-binding protein n=1 Tax=Ornithinicoccus halotolerans TaxID=1748220 RepID=UPI001E3716AC|nr:extracellular solute-binding protein [Ornithinicoccus halotolerans]
MSAAHPSGKARRPLSPRLVALASFPLLMTVAACGAASDNGDAGSAAEGGENGKLVVWDWKSGDAAAQAYFETARADFAEKHPGVELEFVAQPFDNYYQLLGTAIESGSGPDVVLFNGGAQMRERISALAPLDDMLGDTKERLTGWEAFQAEGTTYAVPITLQGLPFYYNKAVYEQAGLDPEAPPATYEELEAVCTAIAETGQDCFSLGNKEGIGIEFHLSTYGAGVFSAEQYDAWLAGDRDWTSPEVKQLFQLWVDQHEAGWYNDGVNSTAKFMDEYTKFQGGDSAHVIGLISDVAHWKSFDEFLGEDLGVFKPPVVTDQGSSFLPAEGGIGYAVTEWTADPELAYDAVESLSSTAALTDFYVEAGAIASDTTIDTSGAGIATVGDIVSWLPESKPLLHSALSAETLELMHRLSQQLIDGGVTVDDALQQLAATDQ